MTKPITHRLRRSDIKVGNVLLYDLWGEENTAMAVNVTNRGVCLLDVKEGRYSLACGPEYMYIQWSELFDQNGRYSLIRKPDRSNKDEMERVKEMRRTFRRSKAKARKMFERLDNIKFKI